MKNEQQTKYPWHTAPDWAMWAATDEDGSRCWFEDEPYIEYGCAWMSEHGNFDFFETAENKTIDWDNSLEKRPGT